MKLMEEKMEEQVNKCNRRDFLMLCALGLVAGKQGYDTFNKIEKRKLEEKTKEYIYHTLPGRVVHYDVDGSVIFNNNQIVSPRNGRGVFIDNYLVTVAHIPDISLQQIHGMMGSMTLKCPMVDSTVSIDGIKGELLMLDMGYDIAIYKFPDNYKKLNFSRIGKTPELGDKVYSIGDPALTGSNIRPMTVSDVNGNPVYAPAKYCFGVDKPMIGGDSGTPFVNKSGELIGLANCTIHGMGYAVKIGTIMKMFNIVTSPEYHDALKQGTTETQRLYNMQMKVD